MKAFKESDFMSRADYICISVLTPTMLATPHIAPSATPLQLRGRRWRLSPCFPLVIPLA